MSKKKAAKATARKRTTKSSAATSTKKKFAKKKVAKKKAVKKTAKKTTKKSAKKTVKSTTKRAATKVSRRSAKSKSLVEKSPVKTSPLKKKAAPAAKQQPRPQREAVTIPATLPASPPEILLTLAKLLLNKPQYHEEVRLAIESPNDYRDTFADELALRGIDQAVPSLPWIALTDGLERHGALVQLDWNFEHDDLIDAIARLPIDENGREQLQGMVGYSTAVEGLAAAGDRLLAAGLALVTVDNNEAEDTFPIAVIRSSDVATAQRLAGELGLGAIRQWSTAV